MPPRYAYWTILIDNAPTAFRAKEHADLLPTLHQLRRTSKNVVLKWFASGRLWDTPEQARAPRVPRASDAERRGRDWRPGGQHKDPRARFAKPKTPRPDWNAHRRDERPFNKERPLADGRRPLPQQDIPRHTRDRSRDARHGDSKPFGDSKPSGENKPYRESKPYRDHKPYRDNKPSRGDQPYKGHGKSERPPGRPPGDRPLPRTDRPRFDARKPDGRPRFEKPRDGRPSTGGSENHGQGRERRWSHDQRRPREERGAPPRDDRSRTPPPGERSRNPGIDRGHAAHGDRSPAPHGNRDRAPRGHQTRGAPPAKPFAPKRPFEPRQPWRPKPKWDAKRATGGEQRTETRRQNTPPHGRHQRAKGPEDPKTRKTNDGTDEK